MKVDVIKVEVKKPWQNIIESMIKQRRNNIYIYNKIIW